MTGVLGEATGRELDLGMIGSVVSPGDPDYETARGVWNHAIDKRPALIVRAASTEEVARAVLFARSEGIPIAVCGGWRPAIPDSVRASYSPAIYAQLQAVKDQYDPFKFFRLNIHIQPTK